MTLGASMAGGNPKRARPLNDFYPTPDEVTRALLEKFSFNPEIHECACGDGSMARVIQSYGYKVMGTDLEPRGFGSKIDFFDLKQPLAQAIITNPPFGPGPMARRFIEHALGVLKVDQLALVLKSTYWHAANRQDLFEEFKPAAICPLTWRPDFLGLGRPTMEAMWCVWLRGHVGEPIYMPLNKV